MTENATTALYQDGSYLEKNPTWHSERAGWKTGYVLRGLKAAGVSPKTLCDIGCGTGLALAEVVRGLPGVTQAVGFEPSPDAPLHTDAKDLIELRRTDATKCSDKFDLAMMLDVFEHVEDYFSFLRACRPLATYQAFHIPLDATVGKLLKSGHMNARRSLGHLHSFTCETALATLEETGHTILHSEYTKTWEGPGRNPKSPMNLFRAALLGLAPHTGHKLIGGFSLMVITKAE